MPAAALRRLRTPGIRGIAVATALGAAIRVARLVSLWGHPLLFNDSLYYSAQARQLAHGVFFHEVFSAQPGAEHGPLTPIVMAAFSWMHQPVPWQRLVTALLGIVTVPLLGLLGRRLGGATVGVVAATIGALYPNLWANDALVMSESLAALLVTVALLALLGWVDTRSTRHLVAAGAVLGLAALTRSELALAIPLAAVAVFVLQRRAAPQERRIRWQRAGVLCLAALAPLVPWVGYNVSRFERPVLLTTNDGTSLIGTNCDEAWYGKDIGNWSLFCVVDETPQRDWVDPSQRSAVQRSIALHYVRTHLRRLPVVMSARVARLLDLYGLHNLVFQDKGEERAPWVSWAGIVSFWLLAPLAVFGLWRQRRAQLAVLVVPVAVALATGALLYGAHRMRISAEPVVVVGAALGTVRLAGRREVRRPAGDGGA